MRSIRTILALTAIFAFAVVPAMAETYTFNVAEGDWDTRTNWYPDDTGPPGAGDTAIISGDDRHCHVESDDQECEILQVVNGGILTIEAPYWLKIGAAGTETISYLGGGTVYFLKETQEGVPELLINTGGVELRAANGGGTLNASKGDGYGPGRIGIASGGSQVLEMDDGVTVKGHLWIYVRVENNGTFEVDDPNDAMIFNKYGGYPAPRVTGSGSFDVSAGTLTFDNCLLLADNTTTWIPSATGTIHITDQCHCGEFPSFHTGCAIDIRGGELWVERAGPGSPADLGRFKTAGKLDMTGGTLDVDGEFKVTGGAQISGGKIEVAPGKHAEFRFPQ